MAHERLCHSNSYDVYSWQSIFSYGSTRDIKQYIFGVYEDCKTKAEPQTADSTMCQGWQVLNWSLRAAFLGEWPDVNWAGNRWPLGSYDDSVKGQRLADKFCLVP